MRAIALLSFLSVELKTAGEMYRVFGDGDEFNMGGQSCQVNEVTPVTWSFSLPSLWLDANVRLLTSRPPIVSSNRVLSAPSRTLSRLEHHHLVPFDDWNDETNISFNIIERQVLSLRR